MHANGRSSGDERSEMESRWARLCPAERSLWFPLAWLSDCLRSMIRTKVLRCTPKRPWLPYGAIRMLWNALESGDRVFEWGCGGSTIWLARLGCRVHSVEHDRNWTRAVRKSLEESALTEKVELRTHEPRETGSVTNRYRSAREEYRGLSFREYVEAIEAFPDHHFDLVIVDGRARSACLEAAVQKVSPSGLLLLDDSDRDRYQAAVKHVESWHRLTFTGLQPYKLKPGFTSIWRNPYPEGSPAR